MNAARDNLTEPPDRKSCLVSCSLIAATLLLLFIAFLCAPVALRLPIVAIGFVLIRFEQQVRHPSSLLRPVLALSRLVGVVLVDLAVFVVVSAFAAFVQVVLFAILQSLVEMGVPRWPIDLAQFMSMFALLGMAMSFLGTESEREELERELSSTPEESIARHETNQRAVRRLIGLRGPQGDGYKAPRSIRAPMRWMQRHPSVSMMMLWGMLTALFTLESMLFFAPEQPWTMSLALVYYRYFAMSSIDTVLLGLPQVAGIFPPASPFTTTSGHSIALLSRFAFTGCWVSYIIALHSQMGGHRRSPREAGSQVGIGGAADLEA